MPVRHRVTAATLVILMLAACAGPRDGDMDGPRGGPPGDMRGGGPASRGDGTTQVREDLQAQLSEVEQRLSLTPQQQVLWDRYREMIGALMADQLRLDPRPTVRVDAPRQIDRKVDVVRNRLVAMEDIAEAARTLYDALDADQRRVADRLLPGTVPALYSGLGMSSGGAERGERDRRGPPGRRD